MHQDLQHIQGPYDGMVGNVKETLKIKIGKVNKLTKASSVTNISNVDNKSKTTIDQKKGDPRADGALIHKKSRSQAPPFLMILKYSIKMCPIVL